MDPPPITEAAAASSVKIETTAKGLATLSVKVVDGVTEEEMERLVALAFASYQAGRRLLSSDFAHA